LSICPSARHAAMTSTANGPPLPPRHLRNEAGRMPPCLWLPKLQNPPTVHLSIGQVQVLVQVLGSRSGIGQYSTFMLTWLSKTYCNSIINRRGSLLSRRMTCCHSATRLFRSTCTAEILSSEQLNSSVSSCSPPSRSVDGAVHSCCHSAGRQQRPD